MERSWREKRKNPKQPSSYTAAPATPPAPRNGTVASGEGSDRGGTQAAPSGAPRRLPPDLPVAGAAGRQPLPFAIGTKRHLQVFQSKRRRERRVTGQRDDARRGGRVEGSYGRSARDGGLAPVPDGEFLNGFSNSVLQPDGSERGANAGRSG